MTQIDMAINQYKTNFVDYPPNFLEAYATAHSAGSPDAAWSQTILARHMKRIS